MNNEWSELNKTMQSELKREVTFYDGVESFLKLRRMLFGELCMLREELSREDFDAIPFINVTGYHSKTIAYSLWHIFRIEDIVAHTLVSGDEQVFFSGGYQRRINSPIITTGNELKKQEIADFSKVLDMCELYSYASEVKDSTEKIVGSLPYSDLREKVSNDRKENLKSQGVVSGDSDAIWLIDFWCNKTIRGLIQMPFSRHWIMHVEAILRIKNKLL